jgi:uncharacterized membrane protein (DUF373 family)
MASFLARGAYNEAHGESSPAEVFVETSKSEQVDAESNWIGRVSKRAFLRVEVSAYLILGALLAIIALIGTIGAVLTLADAALDVHSPHALVLAIDRILLVLMIIEILHTVRVSFHEGALACEQFLIVGLIASIRRMLVITLESSQAQETGKSALELQGLFTSTMIELGVLGGLILVMVWSIFILRRSNRP